MSANSLRLLQHHLIDNNPQNSFETIYEMTLEETLAYVEAEGTNTTENILNLAIQLTP
jgi:hypothetical protein